MLVHEVSDSTNRFLFLKNKRGEYALVWPDFSTASGPEWITDIVMIEWAARAVVSWKETERIFGEMAGFILEYFPPEDVTMALLGAL